ncbi:hypothetical protein GCM10025857_37350 [Alicyclobacillus contaminans]|uniref:YqhG family protein n=1 Tax=Alicyclobacillus contaminans TaxID=392016 RepID=UPI00041ACD98|nr:YqhG family protein [Alicyclobacillus contaminans]GMA52378.1 hypothetical protein GCM10025857_37350 [Alicyclobacillus contaminans]
MNPVPLRTKDERLRFCDAYFKAVGAPVVRALGNDYREYQLPREVDKELTDRPYYWMWVEKTNQDVPLTVLRCAFSDEALEQANRRLREAALDEAEQRGMTELERRFFRPPTAELITFGCFRLDKIYTSLEKRGRFACVAPESWNGAQPLIPWFLMNAIVSFRCDRVEQRFWSIAVCLHNGQVVFGFYDMIQNIRMQPVAPSALLSHSSAALGIEQACATACSAILTALERQSHEWADTARRRLDEEISQIELYYRSILPDAPDDEKPVIEAERHRKIRERTEQIGPRIEIDIRQMALVGLTERRSSPPSEGHDRDSRFRNR